MGKRNLSNELNEISIQNSELLCVIGKLGDELGMRVYAVGGFVRDLLMGVESRDIDISVEGSGILFAQRLFENIEGKLILHEKFQTAAIRTSSHKIDIVTARNECYAHYGSLPTIQPADIISDLFRRDFSINSMAISLNKRPFGELSDPAGGEKDLQDKIIRVLYNMSFMDDPTRIFRAVKFEKRYEFTIESDTINLMKNALANGALDFISDDRITHELQLTLKEKNSKLIIDRLDNLGIIEKLIQCNRLDEKLISKLNKASERWYNL